MSISLAEVDLEFHEGNDGKPGVFLHVLPELAFLALDELEGNLLLVLRKHGEEDGGVLALVCEVDVGDRDEGGPVGLALKELHGESLDDVLGPLVPEVVCWVSFCGHIDVVMKYGHAARANRAALLPYDDVERLDPVACGDLDLRLDHGAEFLAFLD